MKIPLACKPVSAYIPDTEEYCAFRINPHTIMTARTGETCPESGVWKVVGAPSTTAPIAKGNRMPPYDGKAVTWQLIQRA
ncbi:MAG: hypothetical protein EOP04_13415 [Proteobacteria bacterium]|nr:MAG: hypothetical protein EOP04_13415 [Pseudomonadota bacterium]